MTVTVCLKRVVWGMVLLAIGLASAGAKEPPSTKSGYPRTLNGEEIFLFFSSDEWDVAAEFSDGSGTNATFLQDGRIAAVDLRGGGPLDGKWSAKVDESLLCIQWVRVDWSSEGCFRMVQTGPVSYEFRDPASGEWNWKFKITNY
jgi:hypothetical protein